MQAANTVSPWYKKLPSVPSTLRTANHLAQEESLRPEVTRALRATAAFMAPLLVLQLGGQGWDASFAAVGAHVVSLLDVRGAYRVRFTILLVMTAVVTTATWFGGIAAASPVSAVAGMGVIVALSGFARHISADYGPNFGIGSALLFLMALALPGDAAQASHHAGLVLGGAVWATILHVLLWPFRPQHPLRRAVAESWVALSDLFAAMQPDPTQSATDRARRLAEREGALRTTLDHAYNTLAAAATRRSAAFIARLDALQLSAARLGTRVAAFSAALEVLMTQPDFPRYAPTVESLLTALTNTARSVALTTLSRRSEHFAASSVRLRRCQHLIRVLRERLAPAAPQNPDCAQADLVLQQLATHLSSIETALQAAVDGSATRAGFSLRLPDLTALSLRSLASWINPAPHYDPVLGRYTLRMAVLTMLGVAIYKGFDIPRGYWIAFTMIVVLQPDYGSTRQRAGQRIFGTLAASVLASAFLRVHLPLPLLDVLIAATAFGFAYFQKQRYGLAVFCVTLMLVLVTEVHTDVHLDFTLSRLLSNVAGGGLALAAALWFWPSWERQRFPVIMATAFRRNRTYLDTIAERLVQGGSFDAQAVQAKRSAENANSLAMASLQRLLGDPPGQRTGLGQAAALANYNVRITRGITVLTLHLRTEQSLDLPELRRALDLIRNALEALARTMEDGRRPPPLDGLSATLDALATRRAQASPPLVERLGLVHTQLAKIATELSAMHLVLQASQEAAA